MEVGPNNEVVDDGSVDMRSQRGGLEVTGGAHFDLIEMKITLDGS